jgi:hypothetical protein
MSIGSSNAVFDIEAYSFPEMRSGGEYAREKGNVPWVAMLEVLLVVPLHIADFGNPEGPVQRGNG